MFKGENRLIECAGEGSTLAVGAITNLRLKGRKPLPDRERLCSFMDPKASGGTNARLHFPPSLFPSIPPPTLAQSYLKTGQKCPQQMQPTMAHPRPREAREQWTKQGS